MNGIFFFCFIHGMHKLTVVIWFCSEAFWRGRDEGVAFETVIPNISQEVEYPNQFGDQQINGCISGKKKIGYRILQIIF